MDELSLYDYDVPSHLITQTPASPRDSAQLLIYDRSRQTTTVDTFGNIGSYLPPRSVIVLNETKVLPARLPAVTENGRTVELLYLGHTDREVTVLANKKLAVGTKVTVGETYVCTVLRKEGAEYTLNSTFDTARILPLLQQYGKTPIPPYIKHSPLSEEELRTQYQTVFAKEAGSVAAPTASLHFTKELLRQLESAGHTLAYVTLHVGLGTFAKVTKENLANESLHTEYYSIPEKTAELLRHAKDRGRPVVAVGTTVVRALESAWTQGNMKSGYGSTNLFIRPGYKFRVVDHLITNFHVPRSSLLMLVAAMTGQKELQSVYQEAIRSELRFFTFGDAMLVI